MIAVCYGYRIKLYRINIIRDMVMQLNFTYLPKTGQNSKHMVASQTSSFGSLCCLFWCHFLTVFTSICSFYNTGSDGKVTLWERAARSVYNTFSVPCQVLTRATFIIVDCMLR